MRTADPTAYDNAPFIPDGPAWFDRWAEAAAAHRQIEHGLGRARLNQPHGPHPREAFDLFLPAGPAAGLMVFLHGGFWRMGDRRMWSHMAAGAQAAGWAVGLPSYPLCPEVRIAAITRSIAAAVSALAAQVAGPIVLAGHSAGGHLALRMVCPDTALPGAVRGRLRRVMAISPLADLAPLIEMPMNADLRIDAAEALAESPLHHAPPDLPVHIVAGSAERPAFVDQALWMADAWPAARLTLLAGRHHFDVIDPLGEPGGALLDQALAGP